MLRISAKEKKEIQKLNARARNKSKRLETDFRLYDTFKRKTLKEFTTRAELNQYKKEIRSYLAPYTHRYAKVAKKRDYKGIYYEPIKQLKVDEYYRTLKKAEQIQGKHFRKWAGEEAYEGAKPQGVTAGLVYATSKHTTQLTGKGAMYVTPLMPSDFEFRKGGKKSKWFMAKLKNVKTEKDLDYYLYSWRHYRTEESYLRTLEQSKNNFAKAIVEMYGNIAYPVARMITELSADEWEKFYNTNSDIDFDFFYDATYQQMKGELTYIKDIANSLLKFYSVSDEKFENVNVANLVDVARFSDSTEFKLGNLKTITEQDILANYRPNVVKYYDPNVKHTRQVALKTKEYEEYLKTGELPKWVMNRGRTYNPDLKFSRRLR